MMNYREAKRLFDDGKNIIEEFKKKTDETLDLEEIIDISYDLQAGSYTRALEDPARAELADRQGRDIGRIIEELGVASICDAGTGEGTSLRSIIRHSPAQTRFAAFDVSLSRLLYARAFLDELGKNVSLFCAELSHIPLPSNAVDAVLTVHALEPNGGRETELLAELYRVAARYLILIEPDFSLAGDAQKQRMTRHGYVTRLVETLQGSSGRLIRHEPWPHVVNELNRASVFIFEKAQFTAAIPESGYASPISGGRLENRGGFYMSQEDGVVFPVIMGIPILRQRSAILASRIGRFS